MKESNYTKRELDLLFKNLTEKNDAWSAAILNKIDETHRERTQALDDMREHEVKPILEQTTKTNGRVSTLEKRADKNDRWRSWLTGAAFILVPVFISVCSWVILRQLSLDKEIESSVNKHFEQYEVQGTIEIK